MIYFYPSMAKQKKIYAIPISRPWLQSRGSSCDVRSCPPWRWPETGVKQRHWDAVAGTVQRWRFNVNLGAYVKTLCKNRVCWKRIIFCFVTWFFKVPICFFVFAGIHFGIITTVSPVRSMAYIYDSSETTYDSPDAQVGNSDEMLMDVTP